MMIPRERGRVEEIASHQTSQGPADYPSGAMITTTTGGHGDMRPLFDLPKSPDGPLSYMERTGDANIADSADEVRLRVRERRRAAQGCFADQTCGLEEKLPRRAPRWTMFTFSEPEFRAGVEAASDRNTYAAVHAYPPAQIRRAIAVGTSAPSTGT